MEQYKRVNVIMLPTEDNHSKFAKYILDSSFGGCIKENELCTTTSTIGWSNIFKPQHLYIISDDEIKEGDLHITSDHSGFGFRKYKIIATTDASLKVFIDGNGNKSSHELTKSGYIEFLPQPSQQFIEKYVESYNKGEVITDVLVEYNNFGKNCNCNGAVHDGCDYLEDRIELKINPDNTITIKKLKDSWNREEVIKILKSFEKDIENSMDSDDDGNTFNNINSDKWIEENL